MIGVITGMQAEAKALGRWSEDPRVRVGVAGARPDKAEAEARRLVSEGARLLLSFGVAGGLDPTVKPGDLFIASEVVDEEDMLWPQAEIAGLAGARARMLGVEAVVAEPKEKARLHTHFDAKLVDMESHRVARVAHQADLPMVVIRAVADPAARAIPKAALGALDEAGRPTIAPVLRNLLKAPKELPGLLEVKRDLDRALASLAASVGSAMPALLVARR